MREIGTLQISSNIINLHIKRPRIAINKRIGSRKKAILRVFIYAKSQIKRPQITTATCIDC